ncbi:Hypothetical protein FKW44_007919 [Caligus rogercresseyi]|uniref:Uncharacterized protein n=1 Tax=Caligus rogercresseyi TaxID=217165 RepID=A0A7T8KFD9_CALRO|nr:Hypothetical protein FKW44_007919 [Caligus rogercresseyi]
MAANTYTSSPDHCPPSSPDLNPMDYFSGATLSDHQPTVSQYQGRLINLIMKQGQEVGQGPGGQGLLPYPRKDPAPYRRRSGMD